MGDPIEAAAIGTSFAAGRSRTEAIYVSSLKANFGHLEGAAGIAGVIKTVLVLERGIIPPLAGLERINPDIDTDFLNIKVQSLKCVCCQALIYRLVPTSARAMAD